MMRTGRLSLTCPQVSLQGARVCRSRTDCTTTYDAIQNSPVRIKISERSVYVRSEFVAFVATVVSGVCIASALLMICWTRSNRFQTEVNVASPFLWDSAITRRGVTLISAN